MKKFITIAATLILTTLCWSFIANFNCELPDGLYKLEYTYNSLEKPSMMRVEKNNFYQYNNGDTVKGKINWIYKCSFVLEYDNVQADTSKIGKLLLQSFGKPCIKIERISNDTIAFRTTYTENLRITINKGRFIKLK